MKKHIIIIAMALIATYAMGQVDYNKKTDRFCLNSTLRYRNGKEINKDIIEMFKYAGNQEGKRWWTGYYVPKQEFPDKDASEEVKKAMREKWHKETSMSTWRRKKRCGKSIHATNISSSAPPLSIRLMRSATMPGTPPLSC